MPRAKSGFSDDANGLGRDQLVTHGPTIIVDIGFDAAFAANAQSGAIPAAAERNILALVDTGASMSCIDTALAVRLGLPVIDRIQIGGVGGIHDMDLYLAQIHVPALAFTQYGKFAGASLDAGNLRHRAILGRTFLRSFTMHEGQTGAVTIFS